MLANFHYKSPQKFYRGGIFLLGKGNLGKSDFDNSNLFQSYKQLSVNAEH